MHKSATSPQLVIALKSVLLIPAVTGCSSKTMAQPEPTTSTGCSTSVVGQVSARVQAQAEDESPGPALMWLLTYAQGAPPVCQGELRPAAQSNPPDRARSEP